MLLQECTLVFNSLFKNFITSSFSYTYNNTRYINPRYLGLIYLWTHNVHIKNKCHQLQQHCRDLSTECYHIAWPSSNKWAGKMFHIIIWNWSMLTSAETIQRFKSYRIIQSKCPGRVRRYPGGWDGRYRWDDILVGETVDIGETISW